MKTVVDAYVGLWLVMLFLMMCIAFTSINLNIIQARKMFNDIKVQVQASNGSVLGNNDTMHFDSTTVSANSPNKRTLEENFYEFTYDINRVQLSASDLVQADDETWIYNDIYRISFIYKYNVPLFGHQVYPIIGYTM